MRKIIVFLFVFLLCSDVNAGIEKMPIHKGDLRNLVDSVLSEFSEFNMHSESAVELLMGTAAQETGLGQIGLVQRGSGHALGIFQIERLTEKDLWSRLIVPNKQLAEKMRIICGVVGPNKTHLTGNLIYQIVMARLKYLSIPAQLPDAKDVNGLAEYWKKYYNTNLGKGKVSDFIRNYERYVNGTN